MTVFRIAALTAFLTAGGLYWGIAHEARAQPDGQPPQQAQAEENNAPDNDQGQKDQGPDDAPPEGGEVLTQGAVHEAYAQPVVFDPAPGVVAPQEPPAAIEELPPDQKPEGDNVAWISGYWMWDTDQNKFIWTAGLWRAVPEGMEWMPGYWTKTAEGSQWVSGFWRRIAGNTQTADAANAEGEQVSYLPQPPACLENGPVGAQPSQDTTWIPGTWMWQDTRYMWRPGYWTQCYPGWTWCPASYAWTPSGCVFNAGYWDYALARRGLLFAPIGFANPFALRVGYSWTPRVCIDANVFTDYLFCRPRHHCYCFGDYYASNYVNAGIYPWFSFHGSRFGYDPLYAYSSWHYGHNGNAWRDRMRDDYRFRRDHRDARPPHTWTAMKTHRGPIVAGAAAAPLLAASLNSVSRRRDADVRFERINAARRQEFRKEAFGHQAINIKRHEVEAKMRRDARATQPLKANLPRVQHQVHVNAQPVRDPKMRVEPQKGNAPIKKPDFRPKVDNRGPGRMPAVGGKPGPQNLVMPPQPKTPQAILKPQGGQRINRPRPEDLIGKDPPRRNNPPPKQPVRDPRKKLGERPN